MSEAQLVPCLPLWHPTREHVVRQCEGPAPASQGYKSLRRNLAVVLPFSVPFARG